MLLSRHSFVSFLLSLWLYLHLSSGLIFCNAVNITATGSSSGSLNSSNFASGDLLNEFRIHYHRFHATIQQVYNDEMDVFHLRLLGEDLDEFSRIVDQVSPPFFKELYTHASTSSTPMSFLIILNGKLYREIYSI